jgi:hypothetical protein
MCINSTLFQSAGRTIEELTRTQRSLKDSEKSVLLLDKLYLGFMMLQLRKVEDTLM